MQAVSPYDIKTVDLARIIVADEHSIVEIREKISRLFILLGYDTFQSTYVSTLFSDICREILLSHTAAIEIGIHLSTKPIFLKFSFFLKPSGALERRMERFFDVFEKNAGSKRGSLTACLNLSQGTPSEKTLKEIRDLLSFVSKEQLTEEKKNLEKVNLELDSFVYTASHDLRAPLRAISSFASFLEEDNKDQLDEAGRDHLLEIRKGIGRMTKLIDDLLTLSKISRLHSPYEDVDINDLVENARKRIAFDFKEKNVRLSVQPGLPTIACDRIKMEEVFVNLLNNAVKFSSKTDRRPEVQVGCVEAEDERQFYVTDNGIGIAPQYHEQVFGLFKRLHTQEQYEGTGAGLNIVKRIVEDHKGRIWVESDLDKGAKFIFAIPKMSGSDKRAAR